MIADDVVEMLKRDLVSHGFLEQVVNDAADEGPKQDLSEVLVQLLSNNDVEIGIALPTPGYVEFVAWRGTVADRVHRAMEAVKAATGHDKDFAYWLCLRRNVDRFE